MRKGLLAVALFLVSIVLQVETTTTSGKYYTEKRCPFRSDTGGDLAVGELPQIVGVPVNDPNFKSYLSQHLCKATCQKPVRPLTTSDDISDMLLANANFECQNRSVKIDGDSTQEICASFNAQVQKPACEVVDDTIVCIVDTFRKSIYVNIYVQPCGVEFEIYVVNATETFGNLQCNLHKNQHGTIINNVFEVDFLSNSKTNGKKNLVFAPKAEATNIVAYLKLNHAMPAAQTFEQYKDMLITWQELCGEGTGHNTTAMCKSVTANMTKVCKRLRTGEENDAMLRIEKCLKRNYLGLEQNKMQAEIDLDWCDLKKSEMEPNMKECMSLNSKPQTPNEGGGSFAFIYSIGNGMYYMGEAVCEFLCTVYSAVSWVWSWLVWAFYNFVVPSILAFQYVGDKVSKVPYIGFVAGCLFAIMNKFRCYMVESMFNSIGLNQSFMTQLQESCSIMQSECVHLNEGLQNVELLEGRIDRIDQKYTNLEAEVHHSRANQGIRRRRERSLEHVNRQGMHVSPSKNDLQANMQPLQSKIDNIKASWGQYKQNTIPGEVDDWRSGIGIDAARRRSHQNAHRQGMNAFALDESLNPFDL